MLQRRLGVLDLTLITIGAVIGSGIFRTPAVVAQRAHSTTLIFTAWIVGGILSLIGALIFAELASRRPVDGGFYGYLRDAFHPLVAFLLAWTALTVTYVGSTAASAVLFAGYLIPLTGWHVDERLVAVCAIVLVTLINVLGVRQGSNWQNLLVALKVFGIAAVIVTGIFIAHPTTSSATLPALNTPLAALAGLGVAMLPVFFSYNNFQSATYMAAETVEPDRTISRGLIAGIISIVVIYVLATIAYVRVLGPVALSATATPAADVMRAVFGQPGAIVVGAAIATSTLGFISTAALLAPRLYFQMAADGLFFRQIAWISPRTHVPVVAISIHGAIACIIAATGTYERIINWISLPPWIFMALAAIAVFVFRKQDAGKPKPRFTIPLHPWSTLLFIVSVGAVAVSVLSQYPLDSLYMAILSIAGVIFYYVWKRVHARTPS